MKGEKYTLREWWEIWKVICGQALTQRGAAYKAKSGCK